ncbi:MAG: hypothetical protein GX458_05490 [Phyllobacteriaceae bacterium]|nr:hypothetical protein [Phyllobacteriaceae bacterium]
MFVLRDDRPPRAAPAVARRQCSADRARRQRRSGWTGASIRAISGRALPADPRKDCGMLYALAAVILFAVAGYLAFSALDRPLKPFPADIDPVYLLIPTLFLVFGGVVCGAFALGADWNDVSGAISHVITNMFAII